MQYHDARTLILCLVMLNGVWACGGTDKKARPIHQTPSVAAKPVSATAELKDVILNVTSQQNTKHIELSNHRTTELQLATPITMEIEHSDQWEVVSATLALRYDCHGSLTECMTLAPGATLYAPGISHQQCGCTACPTLQPGTYRLRVLSCDGSSSAVSNTFMIKGH